jgi:hypothetical protein
MWTSESEGNLASGSQNRSPKSLKLALSCLRYLNVDRRLSFIEFYTSYELINMYKSITVVVSTERK